MALLRTPRVSQSNGLECFLWYTLHVYILHRVLFFAAAETIYSGFFFTYNFHVFSSILRSCNQINSASSPSGVLWNGAVFHESLDAFGRIRGPSNSHSIHNFCEWVSTNSKNRSHFTSSETLSIETQGFGRGGASTSIRVIRRDTG